MAMTIVEAARRVTGGVDTHLDLFEQVGPINLPSERDVPISRCCWQVQPTAPKGVSSLQVRTIFPVFLNILKTSEKAVDPRDDKK